MRTFIRFIFAFGLLFLAACSTAPTKAPKIPPQVIAAAPAAFEVLADGAVGVAISNGIKPQDLANGAYQLQEFTAGKVVTVQALTAEIQALEKKANFNAAQVAAVIQLRAAFDAIIGGLLQNGSTLSGTAQTTLYQILQDVITASEMMGAAEPGPAILAPGTPATPAPGAPLATPISPATPGAETTSDAGPPAPSGHSAAMATLESPATVGGATSVIIVGALQAFRHITVSAPVASAITVVATFLAAWLAAH